MNNEGTEVLSSGGLALVGIAFLLTFFAIEKSKARTASASKLCIYRKCVYALLQNTPKFEFQFNSNVVYGLLYYPSISW